MLGWSKKTDSASLAGRAEQLTKAKAKLAEDCNATVEGHRFVIEQLSQDIATINGIQQSLG